MYALRERIKTLLGSNLIHEVSIDIFEILSPEHTKTNDSVVGGVGDLQLVASINRVAYKKHNWIAVHSIFTLIAAAVLFFV